MIKQELEFVVLHTNDFHSEFEAMPRIRSLFQAYEREQPPERLLRFDVGDHMDRKRPETEGTMGAVNVEIMNTMGYDAVTIGNNEGLTFSMEALNELYGRLAAFPVLAANLRRVPAEGNGKKREQPSWLKKSIVLTRDGIRFGVIGVTAPFNDFYQQLGWEATDGVAAAQAEAIRLKREEAADIVIVLSHLGLSEDRRMAERDSGIDLILGGHTHHLLIVPERRGNTYIAAAGKFGTHAGILRIWVDGDERRLVRCEGGAVEAVGYGSHPEIAACINKHAKIAAESLNRAVAVLPKDLPADEERESPLGNLLAATLRRYWNAEIGVVNTGQLLGGLKQGPVTALSLHRICPSPINPCFMLLQGHSLLRAIEESMQLTYIRKQIRGFGFRGNVLGTLCLDGVKIELPHNRISSGIKPQFILVGGKPLEEDRWYRVGTIDMFTFGIGYTSLAEGKNIEIRLPNFLRNLLEYTLASPQLHRWIQEANQRRVILPRE